VTGFDLSAANAHAEKAVALYDQMGLERQAAVVRSRLAGYLSSNAIYGVMDISRSLELFSEAERYLKVEPESLAYGYWLGTRSTATGLWGACPHEALKTVTGARRIADHLGHEALGILGEMIHGFMLVSIGSADDGIALVEHAWEAADRLDHRILGMRTAHIRSFWGLALREPRVVIQWAERELSRARLAHVPIQRHTLQGSLAWGYALAGRLADAQRVCEEAGDIPVSVTYAPPLPLWQGDWPAAEAMLREATRRCREMGDRMDECLLEGWTADACRLQGDLDGAEACLEAALAIAVPAPQVVVEAGFQVDLAILELDRGRPDSARRHLDRAAELIAGRDWRGLGDRFALAAAGVAGQEDDLIRAGGLFERALPALRARLLVWDEAEALLRWSRAARAADPTLAAEKLSAALDIYRRCGAGTAWFKRAEALSGSVRD
jgi:tetratricopeptide (TPR) repeat protein